MKKYNKNARNVSVVRKQTGLSLLELLIAMVIGLFLLVGITTSYLSSKKSSITRDQMSILEDNGRVALEILSNTIQHAGYRSTKLVAVDHPFMNDGRPTSYSCGTGINSVLVPTDFPNTVISNDEGDKGDSIGIVYLGDDDVNSDCTGKKLPNACRVGSSVDVRAHRIYSAFFVDDDFNLQCVGSQGTEKVPVAEGVENIQVLYGIDADEDINNTRSVERYVSSADVGSDWGKVVSVQIGILVRTPIEVKAEAESENFTVLNKKVVTPNDRHQRAVFTTSIKLRNL